MFLILCFFISPAPHFPPKKFFCAFTFAWIYQKKIFFVLTPPGFTKKKFFSLSLHSDSLKKNFLRTHTRAEGDFSYTPHGLLWTK